MYFVHTLMAEIDLIAVSNSPAECTAKSIGHTATRSIVFVESLLMDECSFSVIRMLSGNCACGAWLCRHWLGSLPPRPRAADDNAGNTCTRCPDSAPHTPIGMRPAIDRYIAIPYCWISTINYFTAYYNRLFPYCIQCPPMLLRISIYPQGFERKKLLNKDSNRYTVHTWQSRTITSKLHLQS